MTAQAVIFDHDNQEFIDNETLNSFAAPVKFDALTRLVGQFESTKAQITEVHEIINAQRVNGVLGYFFSGNSTDQYGNSAHLRHTQSVSEVFRLEGALNQLTSTYWQLALKETDLLEYMPQTRREQWQESLNAWRDSRYKHGAKPELDMPEFTLDNLQSTIYSLLARRGEFLAERVDGIFRGLSRNHVTNVPEGFSKRMIMSGVYCQFGTIDYTREGHIHDLRMVIAKFMGRDDPDRNSTGCFLKTAKAQRGQWLELDGGSLRIRVYKAGTAHLEVHPEMAHRLNNVLAYLYPTAIPESFRKRPSRPKAAGFKSAVLMDKTFSNEISAIMISLTTHVRYVRSNNFRQEFDKIPVRNAVSLSSYTQERSKHLMGELNTILQALGAVQMTENAAAIPYWQFDYDALDLIHKVAALGYIPDAQSHQFYPTPKPVAELLVDLLAISEGESVLEPEAGQGGIADELPREQTTCVEVSPIHCDILARKGHQVEQVDFLGWNPGRTFDVVAMNPPYSEGRWQSHLQKAASLVSADGRIGALLPMTAKHNAAKLLPGFDIEFYEPIHNAFEGTAITVIPMIARKAA
tara:strand:+ start:3769 stop:5502 length:1734 start_codon:yes stop_codon:yes gene_type:complete